MGKLAYDSETGTKRCSNCRKRLSVSEFYPAAKQPGGVQGVCKKCSRKNVLEWQAKFPERTNAKNKKWKEANHDQVLQASAYYRKNNRERIRAWNREYARKYRARMSKRELHEYYRRCDLSRKYGISIEEYDQKLIAQDGRCAICLASIASQRSLAVDHCHKTQKVRGLLCGHCNPLLHKLEADSDWIYKAVEYLKQYLEP